ncbi:MAG: hypothetical protein AB1346_10975 [Thermodesulfobacteriota bacterium]
MKEGDGKYQRRRLYLRRQFLLGPRHAESLEGWRHHVVAGRSELRFTVSPDLPVVQEDCDGWQVTLLGYILDPSRPERDDRHIVGSLARELSHRNRMSLFPELTCPYGGRWILVASNGEETWLLNDPMGLRQAVYTNGRIRGGIWCASQPGAIAGILGLEMDPEAVTRCINSQAYQLWDEYLWPADRTPYREISHLLPNHVLDLQSGVARRFWPDRPLGRLDPDRAVQKVGDQLRGLMKAADRRFELTLSLSSGWDSRVVLASSRDISRKIECFTLRRWRGSPDEINPPKLAGKLGIKHIMVDYPETMDPDFKEIYTSNVTCAHELQGRMAQGVFHSLRPGPVRVTGNAAEIARVRFRVPANQPVTPLTLVHFHSWQYQDEFKANKFVVGAWEDWLSDARNLENVNVLDLFYWEHWAGNFVAVVQLEWDIAQEALALFNCRQLLMDMLSVDEKYRDHDRPELFRRLCVALWPKVLSVPVNALLPPYIERCRELGFNRFVPGWLKDAVKRHYSIPR